MRIGSFELANQVFVAPMAGVTDRPFRMLCKQLGAGYAVSEMVTSRPDLWKSLKTSRRLDHTGESSPIAVQIAGTDTSMMADAARYNIEHGAQIIDINMGCPAKKVCNKWAGSALMQDEALAVSIAKAVVDAAQPFGVPVTLKMRTGWCQQHKNAVTLARRFEEVGVQMLTVHGRTREQGYSGQAEYDTIAAVKQAVNIPVVANGDIDSPEKAQMVLRYTGADAVMIGRAAQGRPWIFREISYYLATGEHLAQPLQPLQPREPVILVKVVGSRLALQIDVDINFPGHAALDQLIQAHNRRRNQERFLSHETANDLVVCAVFHHPILVEITAQKLIKRLIFI